MKAFSQGDIIWMDFNPQAGHEQAGRRPALVVSRSKFNANTMSRRALRPELPSRSQTRGCILCDHARFVDLAARNAEFREVAPKEIVQASLAILQALLSPDE